MRKNVICANCGAVLEVDTDASPEVDRQVVLDELLCLLPDGFEWILPAGKIAPVIGNPIYVSSRGEHLTRKDYIIKYNIDPEIAYEFMRSKIGKFAAQTIAQEQPRELNKSSCAVRTNDLSDEIDWTN